jgi:hypothetical protein
MFALVFFTAFIFQSDQDKFQELRQMGIVNQIHICLPIFLFAFSIFSFVHRFKKLRLKFVDFLKGIYQGATPFLNLKIKLVYFAHLFYLGLLYRHVMDYSFGTTGYWRILLLMLFLLAL